jgi:DNA-binding transcriptional regulator YiaG
MAIRDIKELDHEYFTDEELRDIRAEAAREILELNLKQMRESLAMTQQELAERLKIAQSQLSRLENRDDHLVSTLRKYVEALGGEFEAYATFEGRKIKLLGI